LNLKPKPQGNAMSSVRIAAAGAVVTICASFLTVPASACDFDRYQKKCDRELAARAESETASERKSAKRAKATSRRARHLRTAKRMRTAPRFAVVKRERGNMKLASAEVRAVLLPESALTRRFRGFIDPTPISQNSFEQMRKPHPMALDFDPTLIVPQAAQPQTAVASAADAPATPPATATVAAAKQDKAVPAAATIQLASSESRPVTLPPLASRPATSAPVAPPAIQASIAESAPVSPSGFSVHALVLALCGALGAASALRFIVGA
jgi:hypothetical protein